MMPARRKIVQHHGLRNPLVKQQIAAIPGVIIGKLETRCCVWNRGASTACCAFNPNSTVTFKETSAVETL